MLSSYNDDELFRRLFESGVRDDIQKVESWAMKGQLGQLSKLEKILDRVTNASLGPLTYRDAIASNGFIQAIHSRIQKFETQHLHSRYQKLLAATRGGAPVFSWSMPLATASNPALTTFLRSPRTGPKLIIVGGGINNARSLAGTARYSYRGYLSSGNRDSYQFERGYSATIEATQATGQNASIRVTKTRAFHEARMKKYREDLSELSRVSEEIRKLGEIVTVPAACAASAAATRPIISIDSADQSQPNPAKKRRVKAPILSDAEIVEIEYLDLFSMERVESVCLALGRDLK